MLDFLREYVKPDTTLVDGAVSLPDGLYERMEGLELTSADIERLNSRGYTPREAKKSDTWRALAGKQKLLDTYVDAVVSETGRDQDLMNLYFGGASKVPTGRLWYVYSRIIGSNAVGNYSLTNDNGRLVGVAPEAHVASVLREARAKK